MCDCSEGTPCPDPGGSSQSNRPSVCWQRCRHGVHLPISTITGRILSVWFF